MKKLLSFCLVCALTLSVSSHASAIAPTDSSKLPASPSVYLDANEKIAFAASIDQQVSRIKDEIKPLTASRDETVEYLLLEVPLATGDDRAQLISELESYGIYEFEGNVIESAVPMSDSGDVDLTTPQVFYDSLTKEWTVTCGGSWKSREWVSERPVQGNVGGSDAFGVGYTYTNGDYNTLVVSASAALRTEDKQKYKLTDYRSDGDGSKGFGFRLQDEVIWNNGAYDYLGAKWSGVAHTMPNLFPTLESQQDIISTRTIERLSTIFPLDLMGNMRVSTLVYLFRANRSMLSVVISDLAKEGALASTCKNFSYY